MFLKYLKIEHESNLIRIISFQKGLNLIVDETTTDKIQESGNNVGKTTVLKLIDFCLGGNGDIIYRDSEFKDKSNVELEYYLKDNNIVITLALKGSLFIAESEDIIIRRNFLSRKEKIQEINGKQYKNEDFLKELKRLVFDSASIKPTFRQIIAKSIRYDKLRIDNTIKVLHPSTTFEEYEALYFYWLGIDTDSASKKQKLQLEKSAEEDVLKRLRKETSFSLINQALSVLESDIDMLNKAKAGFNINKDFENDLHHINIIKAQISSLSTEISRLEIRHSIILETQEELSKQEFSADLSALREIYETANSLMPEVQNSFEQLVKFHNSMIEKRIEFVTKELPLLEEEITAAKGELQNALAQETLLANKLNKSDALDGLEYIIQALNLKYQQKGKYEEQLRQWNAATEKLAEAERQLEAVNAGISSYGRELDEGIAVFNKFFSKISERLYGEQFILSQHHNGRAYQLDVNSIGGLGTGKKKGLTAAFDIAFIEFCDEKNIPCLHFILHDQVESVHNNQLSTLAEVTSEANVQFVVSILRDKLPGNTDYEQYQVVTLSQDNKLFRL